MRSLITGIFLLFIEVCIVAQTGASYNESKGKAGSSIMTMPTSEKTGELIFPSAFRWNRSGPTGGFWNPSEQGDFVFHPVSRNVREYRLNVYSRSGKLVYRSNDLHKGWDGYLENGDLASQGVYIWIVKGRFSDGTAFDLIGDVTFLY